MILIAPDCSEPPSYGHSSLSGADVAAATAFLIGVPEQQNEYVLALPEPSREQTTPSYLCGIPTSLPSSVLEVKLELQPEGAVHDLP